MRAEELKAKVFISCGQRCDEEKDTAERIKKALICEGYNPYVAVQKQTLRDLRHNIFKELEDSEYIVFVDFKREALVYPNDNTEQSIVEFLEKCQWRGSLFCHQELALASYLDLGTDRDMEILAFHEKGVKPKDGMMGALQVNSEEFTDPGCLPKLIACRARKKWKTQWKNRLQLTVEPPPDDGPYRHIKVNNQHHRKHAINCYAYLKAPRKYSNGKDIPTMELKWEFIEVGVPNVAIAAGSMRRFDAFWVKLAQPKGIRLSTHADTCVFEENIITDPGTHELTYVVISENFPDAEIACGLEIGCDGKVKCFKENHTNDKDMVDAAGPRDSGAGGCSRRGNAAGREAAVGLDDS